MTFKSILFCLFLYVSLVWVGAYYFYTGEQIQRIGLLWTGAGLAGVLVFILFSRLFAWWRLWRARAASRPAARPKPVERPAEPVPEDEAALNTLLAEANAVLGRMKAYANRPEAVTLATFPVYLLVGPEGAGKTSAFLDAGLEPHLLAGHANGTGASGATRSANIWLAKEKIFIELGGRAFNGDLNRWQRLLAIVRGRKDRQGWQSYWKEADQGLELRGVIACCDAKEFTAAVSPQARERLENQIRHWQERLGAVADVFGIECPVYVLVSQCDSIPYFADYFRRLGESESGQVLGCAVESSGAPVDAESKLLTKSFNGLYYSLAEKRIDRLAHEPDPARRPSIYEFPRELKRIRGPFVQFLANVFRPNPLRPGPQLRGYYLSGTIEREAAANLSDTTRTNMRAISSNLEATHLFRSDATQIMRGGGDAGSYAKYMSGGSPSGPLIRKWLFVREFFENVVPSGYAPRRVQLVDSRARFHRRLACFAVCGVCAFLCIALLISWTGNLHLLHSLRNETVAQKRAGTPSLADLESLEDLRVQLTSLQQYDVDGPPWRLRWGLYSGKGMLGPMRQTYFRRFQELLLNPLNQTITGKLAQLPATPGPNDKFEPAFRLLKTEVTITTAACRPESALIAEVLKETRTETMPVQEAGWQALADRQIDFYAAQLPSGNPCKLVENRAACDRARGYLGKIQGVDRMYAGLLASARKAFPNPQRLSDLAPGYQRVISGPAEIEGVFTREGWSYFEKAAKSGKSGAPGEACVLGEQGSAASEGQRDNEAQRSLQRMFLRDYAEHWRKYVAGFSVNRYYGAADAARKLDALSGHKSPLLALLALTSAQTTFPQTGAETDGLAKVTPMVQKYFPKLARGAQGVRKARESEMAPREEELSVPSDVTKAFQPVHWVVPAGSGTWVVDKNSAYVDALAALGHSMDDIARAGDHPDATIFQAASQNYDKALDAARAIARGFEPVGVAGLDVAVEHLLEAPIRLTQPYIITDLDSVAVAKVNGQLRQLCSHAGSTLRRYPFDASGSDATLDEVAGLFAPNTGAIWKFEAQAMSELLVKEGARWQVKDPAKKPQVLPEMLNFLNRAQAIADVFYPAGATQPQFTYTLRPRLDPSFKDAVLELEVDGQMHVWNSSLQKQFVWPPPANARDNGMRGRIRMGTVSFPFVSRAGVWAIFKAMSDAEPRALGSRLVEWKYVRGGEGRLEAIQPAPVRLEFVEFPGGADVFNPRFLQGLACPARAVQ